MPTQSSGSKRGISLSSKEGTRSMLLYLLGSKITLTLENDCMPSLRTYQGFRPVRWKTFKSSDLEDLHRQGKLKVSSAH